MAIDWADGRKVTTGKPVKRPGKGGWHLSFPDSVRCLLQRMGSTRMSVEDINRVTLAGGLTRDPELRRSNGGTPVLNLRLAYAKRRGNRDDDLETQYVDVVCRGALAVKVARDLHRGSQIYVDGKLDLRTWVDRSTGRDRQVHRVDAGATPSNVIYLGTNRSGRTRATDTSVASTS